MKKVLIVAFAAMAMAACAPKQTEESAAPKTLVLYYSQRGATEKLAQELQAQLNADIESIVVENAYDGDYASTIERCKQEMEAGTLPTVNPIQANIADYDQIFLCYPVWFGTYALPIASMLKDNDFAGKKVVACCTFGSGDFETSVANLAQALPKAEVVEGFCIRDVRIAKVADELNRFLIEHGYKDGQIDALPAFMEHHPVTDEEVAVFDQACGSYMYPMGTPIDVAVRETATATDYEFTSLNKNREGEDVNTTVFITKEKKDGAKAEFTRVIR